MDTLTGDVFFGQNTGIPKNLHPLLQQRLTLYNDMLGKTQIVKYGAPGSHSEFNALNDALWARQGLLGRPLSGADLNEMLMSSVFLRGTRQMTVVQRCLHCGALTTDVPTVGEL